MGILTWIRMVRVINKGRDRIYGSKQGKKMTICASHMELTACIRPRGSKGVRERVSFVGAEGGNKKMTEGVLINITNELDPKPNTLKASRVNKKLGSSRRTEAVESVLSRGESGPCGPFIFNARNPPVEAGVNRVEARVSFHETRPPDPNDLKS